MELVCSPINYADLLKARGYYGLKKPEFPLKMGLEGLFRVIAKGNQCQNIEIGDYVLVTQYEIGIIFDHRYLGHPSRRALLRCFKITIKYRPYYLVNDESEYMHSLQITA